MKGLILGRYAVALMVLILASSFNLDLLTRSYASSGGKYDVAILMITKVTADKR